MCSNRFFRQSGRFGRCGCSSCCGNCSDTGFSISRVNYPRRFLNVPMRVFNGAGYTSQDALESIAGSLETISQNSCGNGCGCRSRSSGCGCC